MKSMGLELPGTGGVGNWEGSNRKRETLMKEARYGVGSILVEEGMPPTTVFVIVEGECRIVKGRPKPKSSGRKKIPQVGVVGVLEVALRLVLGGGPRGGRVTFRFHPAVSARNIVDQLALKSNNSRSFVTLYFCCCCVGRCPET